MDPLSIAGTCVSLVGTITKTSILVTGFVRDVRAARTDLDAVSRELLSLKTVLELLAEDVANPTGKGFPETLQKQISGIVTNCSRVVAEIEQTLKKHEGTGLKKSAQWAVSGKEDIAKLRSSLEAHKSALEIALDMIAMTLTIGIKADTQEILNGNSAIKQDTALILAEISRLQEQLPRDELQTSGFMLQRYLDNLTSYAETVCDTFSDEIEAPPEHEASTRSIMIENWDSSSVSLHSERSNPEAGPTSDEFVAKLSTNNDDLPQSVLPKPPAKPELTKKPPTKIPNAKQVPQKPALPPVPPRNPPIPEQTVPLKVTPERLPTQSLVPQKGLVQGRARQQPTPNTPPTTPYYSKGWPASEMGYFWARSSVEPTEVQELLRGCTLELKSKALNIPFFLLPYPLMLDGYSARDFIEHFFSERLYGKALAQELRLMDPLDLRTITKWCWSRLEGGVVGWEVYELFCVGESDSNMVRNSFQTFIPLSVDSSARTQIIFDFFDLLSATAARSKSNGLGGRELSRLAGWWAFEHANSGEGFVRGYKNWVTAADATSHLFFAYLRSLYPISVTSINPLPISLQKLLSEAEYPPASTKLSYSEGRHVVMVVDAVAHTPLALLRRVVELSQYRRDDETLQDLSGIKNLALALTPECRQVLERISSDYTSSEDAMQSSQVIGASSHSKSNSTTSTTSPSWPDFLSSSYSKPSSSTDVSLAEVSTFNLEDTFSWAWRTSLGDEEPQERKSAFGRSILIETIIPGGPRMVVEEMVNGVAPVLIPGNGKNRDFQRPEVVEKRPVVEKKRGFWGRWKKSKSNSESKPKGAMEKDGPLQQTSNIGHGTSIGSSQDPRIRAVIRQAEQKYREQEAHALTDGGHSGQNTSNPLFTLHQAGAN